jgi:hypothetical protein
MRQDFSAETTIKLWLPYRDSQLSPPVRFICSSRTLGSNFNANSWGAAAVSKNVRKTSGGYPRRERQRSGGKRHRLCLPRRNAWKRCATCTAPIPRRGISFRSPRSGCRAASDATPMKNAAQFWSMRPRKPSFGSAKSPDPFSIAAHP